MARADTLSHHKLGRAKRKAPKSLRSILSQHSPATEKARALYSTLVEERDTVGYFLADQVIRQFPRKTRMPEIDFISIGSPA